MTPLWSIVSDDLTGLQAICGEFARLGFKVGTGLSKLPSREELQGFEVFGFDTAGRPLEAAQAAERVAQAVKGLRTLGATQLLKHNDSIMQGHIGPELRALVASAGESVIYAPACPNRGRWTVGGEQMEVDAHGRPVAGGLRVDISKLVSKGTGNTTSLLDLETLHSDRAVAFIENASGDVLVVDATSDADLDRLVKVADWARCRTLAGSVGLAAALARASTKFRRDPAPILVVAGSLQNPTRLQTKRLLQRHDCVGIEIPCDLRAESLVQAVAAARASLAQGRHCVVWSAHDSTNGKGYPTLGPESLARLRRDLGTLIRGVAGDGAIALGGMVVAGGSTADLALRDAMQVTRLTGIAWLCEGMTLAIASDGTRPGLAVVTKSGGWGSPEALADAVDRLAAWRCSRTSEIAAAPAPATL